MADERAELAASSWRNILAWCRQNAPVTAEELHGPASEDALSAAQAEMGFEWPSELLAWLRVGDGAERSLDARLIPRGFIPLSVDRIMSDWRMLVGISADLETEDALRAFESDVAGSYSGFIPAFILIGEDTGGGYLFIDMRSGPKSRCIREWENGAAYPREPLWDSLASMLADIDEALQTGQWRDGETEKIATVEEGALKWKSPDQDW